MMQLVMFEDGLGEIGPLCDLRPSFAVRTGALTTRERMVRSLGLTEAAIFVRPELIPMAKSRKGEPPVNELPIGHEPVLVVNGRCAAVWDEIRELKVGEALVEAWSGHLIAAVLERERARVVLNGAHGVDAKTTKELAAPALISRPWHARTFRDRAIDADLALLLDAAKAGAEWRDLSDAAGVVTFGHHPAMAAATARIYPGVVLDREHGPIVIDEHAVVRPGVTIIGPAYIGKHSQSLDKALIKGHTAIGPWCKIAGEVGGTIFHGFANKAHDGHLGDSWVGKWANLGAGTTNSNLLNTYAEVVAQATPSGRNERTGHQFLGCVLGDHVKTAICTRIMTGTIVHTGAMLAQSGAVSGCIDRFAWATDAAPSMPLGTSRYRIEKFLEVAKAVMGRRKLEMSDVYAARLMALHAQMG